MAIIILKSGLKADLAKAELLEGEVAITSDTNELFVGGENGSIDKITDFYKGSTPPETFKIWLDTSINQFKQHNGTDWVIVNDPKRLIDDINNGTDKIYSSKKVQDLVDGLNQKNTDQDTAINAKAEKQYVDDELLKKMNSLDYVDENGLIKSTKIPDQFKEIKVVANITERNALFAYEGMQVFVKDNGDGLNATYLFDGTQFIKISDANTPFDALVDWGNVQNKPDLSTYALKTDIPPQQDLSGYALKSDVPNFTNKSTLDQLSDDGTKLLFKGSPISGGSSGQTVINASPYFVGSGSCYAYNASAAKLNVGANAKFTVEMWIKPVPGQSQKYLMNKNYSASQLAIIYNYTGSPGVEIVAQVDLRTGSFMSVPDDGNWHWICYSYDSNILRGYVDGIKKIELTKGLSMSLTLTNIVYGAANTSGSNVFQGPMNEIRFWTEARAEADILANWNKVLVNPSSYPNLKEYYPNTTFKFGASLIDSAPGNLENLSLTGTAWTMDYPPIT